MAATGRGAPHFVPAGTGPTKETIDMRVTPILAAALLTASAAGVYAQATPPPSPDDQNSAQTSDQPAAPSQDEADKNSQNEAGDSQYQAPDSQADSNDQNSEAPPPAR